MLPQSDPLIGHEIDGYLIEKLLGRGGMASVYQARDVRLGRYVAVKVIHAESRNDADYTRRFEKEARAVAQLQHSHVVSIYRFGEVGGLYYMAMQYIEGVDLGWLLEDYARSHEIMQYDDILRIMSQVGSALDYAHSVGVIHRDIKPSNIMLDNTGRAVVTDFGLALVQVEGTYGEIFGTPDYIAPEQAINSAGSVPQSDQYSLGVILYQMLTSSLPYKGDTPMDVAMAHMSEPLPSPLERNPDLHAACVRVLEKVLQKEPANRYLSCAALADDLRQAIKSQTRQPSTLKHVSMLRVSEQVEQYQAAHPLPPLPAPVLNTSGIVAPQSTVTPQSAPTKKVSKSSSTLRRPVNQRQIWMLVAAASAGIIVAGLVGIMALVLSQNRNQSTEQISTATDIFVVAVASATVESSMTPFVPSMVPTHTAVVEVNTLPTETNVMIVQVNIPPTATNTFVPAIPEPTIAPTVAVNINWNILLLANGGDTFYVMNASVAGLPPFPLSQFNLSGEDRGGISGSDWTVQTLNIGECVRLEKNDNSDAPDITCTQVGEAIRVNGSGRFWREGQQSLNVSYAGAWGSACENSLIQSTGCYLQIPISIVNG